MEPGENLDREEKSRFPAALAAGAIVILVLAGIVVLLAHFISPPRQAADVKLPFGATEQAYAAQIHFQSLQLSHSTNLLNQEFTYVGGIVSNDGPRAVDAVEVEIEFHDPFHQVILKETERPVRHSDQPLRVGEQREFQITIEQGIPSAWDQQYPSIRITGLTLE
jgi:hypothetical protein